MTLKQCESKARQYIDFYRCDEYEKAYVFYSDEEYEDGGNSCVVILKETGKAITFVQFILEYHPEKEPVDSYYYLCGGIKPTDPAKPGKAKKKLK